MIESFRDFAPTETADDHRTLSEMNKPLKTFYVKDLICARDSVLANPFLAYNHLNIAMLNMQVCADITLWSRTSEIRHDVSRGLHQMAHQALVNLCDELS